MDIYRDFCESFGVQFLIHHDQILKIRNHEYNPYINLLRIPFSPRYSSPILKAFFKYYKPHATRESLRYAISLLQTGDQAMILRAQKILYKVLSLQNIDPTSKYYGVWPKYWETSIIRIYQPDLNWSDFLGSYLLLVSLQHRHQLPYELINRVDAAVIVAARAIQRRNVDLNYTNIAVRGIYVVLVAGETYAIKDLFDYGLQRLHQIHSSTIQHDIFTEYNSPVYGVSTLDALGRLRLHVKDELAKVWIEDLYWLAWENIAHYFHWPTHQLAGPHSRSYKTQLGPDVLALIEKGTNGQVKFGLSEPILLASQPQIPLPCPFDLKPFFLGIDKPCTRVKTFLDGTNYRQLTTYMTPEFTLGSVNYSDLWHQRRSLLAYWGTPEQLGYLRIRFLCDGDDFAPAQFASIQSEGNVLAGIMFATDVDRHNPYVTYNAGYPLQVKDLRLQFELMGTLTELSEVTDGLTTLECCVEGIWVQLVMSYARFGAWVGQWEVTQRGSKIYLDWVFCKDRGQSINLAKLGVAAMGMGMSVSKQYKPMPPLKKVFGNGILALSWGSLLLSFQICPDRQAVLHQSVGSSIDSRPVW